MINGYKILGLIPARGGSKGIPRKNIKLLGGKPLIAWTIDEAKKSKYIDRLIVSTDDQEIADVAIEWGAEIPFMRPPRLATDTARGVDVVLHALQELSGFDVVALLQPTSPFRVSGDIDGAIEFWADSGSTVVGVVEATKSPYWMYNVGEDGRLERLLPMSEHADNRQNLPTVYVLNGAVYITDRSSLLEEESFLSQRTMAYVMPSDRSIDIDTDRDWTIAECLASKG